MIHISLDTDVWLYLLSQRLEEITLLDELYFWISNNHIKVIIPQNIVDEWSRNKDDKIRQAKKDFSSLYNLKSTVLADDSAVKASIDPNKFEEEAKERIGKLYHIFNKLAIVVETTDEIILEASDRNLKCLAPNHADDSFRDTINILSILNYLRDHPEIEPCFFCTHNYKDFSLNKNEREKLHDHLKKEFQEVGLKYIYNYKRLWSTFLKKNLPDYSEYLKEEMIKKEKEEINEKESSAIEIEDYPPSFLSNVSLIDQILAFDRPSSAQVKFVISLMDDDEAYSKYVFKNVSTPFWFEVFRKSGFYDPSKIPGPKKHDDGAYSFPNWPPLQLLEKLSKRIGEDLNED